MAAYRPCGLAASPRFDCQPGCARAPHYKQQQQNTSRAEGKTPSSQAISRAGSVASQRQASNNHTVHVHHLQAAFEAQQGKNARGAGKAPAALARCAPSNRPEGHLLGWLLLLLVLQRPKPTKTPREARPYQQPQPSPRPLGALQAYQTARFPESLISAILAYNLFLFLNLLRSSSRSSSAPGSAVPLLVRSRLLRIHAKTSSRGNTADPARHPTTAVFYKTKHTSVDCSLSTKGTIGEKKVYATAPQPFRRYLSRLDRQILPRLTSSDSDSISLLVLVFANLPTTPPSATMSLTCGLFRRRSKSEEEKKKPRRARTISIFDPSIGVLKRMIRSATMISPIKLHDRAYTISQVVSLARELSMTPEMVAILEDVYNGLRKDEPELSKEAFLEFVMEIQGEATVHLENEKYTLGEFLYVLAHDDRWHAVRKPSEKDYSKPITNYFINSSHNTYISGNQLASKTSPEAYMNVLKRGGRCIEIDVWNCDDVFVDGGAKPPSGSNHTRNKSAISGSSLPYAAAVVFETMEDKIESAKKKYLSNPDPRGHSRSTSSHSRTMTDDASSRSSNVFLVEGTGSTEKLEVPRQSRTRQSLPRGEPIVTHGWTFTTPCGFREVCETIRDHAFAHGNDLPIIISLEVHADHSQQEVMARIMKEVWGDMLVQQPFEGCDPKFRVPTLDDLRCKILVKVKRAVAKITSPADATASLPIIPTDEDGSTTDDERAAPRLRAAVSSPAKVPSQQDENGKMTICKALSDLAIYTRSERFKSLSTPQAKQPTHIFSISEDRIIELHEKFPREVFTHNKNFFMRAFPAGRRIDSSNPDPSLFWRRGVQMVAMNWQNMDEGMMLNEAMFAGEDGWVLKPSAYLGSDKASITLDLAAKHTLDLTITVFAGHNIPTEDDDQEESALRPIVKAELHIGEDEKDGHEHSYKRHTKASKTSNPVFKAAGEKLQFLNIPKVVEELSFIR
ncbi:phospholipase c, partial [Trichoderma arundinaceum]